MRNNNVAHPRLAGEIIWVRSRNCGCLVTWFCYQLIAKPGNKTATVSWPDPYTLPPTHVNERSITAKSHKRQLFVQQLILANGIIEALHYQPFVRSNHGWHIWCNNDYVRQVPNTLYMMTSSNGNIFRVIGHLCGKFTGPRWIPRTKASDAELWCFLWSASDKRLGKQSWGWWFETLSCPLWRLCNDQ